MTWGGDGYDSHCAWLRTKFPDGSAARYNRPGSAYHGQVVTVVGPGEFVKEGVNIHTEDGQDLFVGYEDLRPLSWSQEG